MRDELRALAVAFAIMSAVVGAGYAFTAAFGAGPSSQTSAGFR